METFMAKTKRQGPATESQGSNASLLLNLSTPIVYISGREERIVHGDEQTELYWQLQVKVKISHIPSWIVTML